MSGEAVQAGQQITVWQSLCTNVTNTTPSASVSVAGYNGGQMLEVIATGTVAAQAVTLQFEGSFDGTNWYLVGQQQVNGIASPARSASAFTLTPGNGTIRNVYQVLDAYRFLRVNPTANTLGTGLSVNLYAQPL